MSREINFRAWDNLLKKIRNVEVMCRHGGKMLVWRLWDEQIGLPPLPYPSDRFILMQFTGLKDKNGKDIYEGDIFKPFSEGINYYKVVFEKGCFGLHHNYGYWGTLGRFFELANENKMEFEVEVIGNIFQNPELLETKKA